MVNYNLTAFNQTNTNTILDAINILNTNTNNAFGLLILVSVFFGYYFLFSKEQKLIDLVTSSFLTLIISLLMLFLGMIGFGIVFALIVLFLGLTLLYYWVN